MHFQYTENITSYVLKVVEHTHMCLFLTDGDFPPLEFWGGVWDKHLADSQITTQC